MLRAVLRADGPWVLTPDGRGLWRVVGGENVNHRGAGLDGAVRHVPGLNPGLKVPTPPVGGVQAVPPFRGRICLAQCAGAKGGPKGGRPVVEERVNVNHQGAGLDGAVRHVPGLNPGLKVPTPPVGGVQAVFFLLRTLGEKAARCAELRGCVKTQHHFSHRFIMRR